MNEIIEYDTYAEIVLCDRNGNEKARTIIDLEDVEKVNDYKWRLSGNNYATTGTNKRLHRLIVNCPDDMVVDHINGDRLDNRKENLRICTHQQNDCNRKLSKKNTSGHTGVYWNKRRSKWQANIKVNYKNIFLGYFNTKEEAIDARKQAEIDYFGEYRRVD